MGEAAHVARYQQRLESLSKQQVASHAGMRILHAYHLGGHCCALHLAVVSQRGTAYAADAVRAGRALGDLQFFDLQSEFNITVAMKECPLVCDELFKMVKPGATFGIMEFIALAVNDNFTCMPLSVAPKAGEPMSNAMMVSDVLLQRLSKESPIRCDAIPHLEDFTWSHYQFMGGQGGMALRGHPEWMPGHHEWMPPRLKRLVLSGTILYWLLVQKRFEEALKMFDTMTAFVNSGGVITELPAPGALAQHQQLLWLQQNPERASQLLLCALAGQQPPAIPQPHQQIDLSLVGSALAAETALIAAAAEKNPEVQKAEDLMVAVEVMTKV